MLYTDYYDTIVPACDIPNKQEYGGISTAVEVRCVWRESWGPGVQRVRDGGGGEKEGGEGGAARGPANRSRFRRRRCAGVLMLLLLLWWSSAVSPSSRPLSGRVRTLLCCVI